MHSLFAELTPGDRPAVVPAAAHPAPLDRAEPPRVIEIGEITAGIAVPEERGVRFFSSARDFDGLDGLLFRTAEQATRAARERVRARSHADARQDPDRRRRA